MNDLIKNVIVLLVLGTVGLVAYFVLTQEDKLLSVNNVSESRLQNLILSAEEFGYRQDTLDRINLDEKILSDKNFIGLQSFSQPLSTSTIGRLNPFLPTERSQASQ